jgi:hypothetical protein
MVGVKKTGEYKGPPQWTEQHAKARRKRAKREKARGETTLDMYEKEAEHVGGEE